jgi:hypothetical protein
MKWQLWCEVTTLMPKRDFNQKVWVAMHGVGWRVKKWWHQCVDTTTLKMYERTDVDWWDNTGFWCLTHIYLSATYESIRTGAIFFVSQMYVKYSLGEILPPSTGISHATLCGTSRQSECDASRDQRKRIKQQANMSHEHSMPRAKPNHTPTARQTRWLVTSLWSLSEVQSSVDSETS